MKAKEFLTFVLVIVLTLAANTNLAGSIAPAVAPLASAGEEVQGDGVAFTVVGTSAKPERVWWKKDGVLYWVSNTLLYELSKEDLLAVAMSAVSVPAP